MAEQPNRTMQDNKAYSNHLVQHKCQLQKNHHQPTITSANSDKMLGQNQPVHGKSSADEVAGVSRGRADNNYYPRYFELDRDYYKLYQPRPDGEVQTESFETVVEAIN